MLSPLLSLLCSLPALPQAAADDGTGPLLIRAERVIVRPGEILEQAAVLIEDGVIVAVGEGLAAPAGAREIEGDVVCAGFVNPWTSLGIDPESETDTNTTPGTPTADVVDAWGDPHLRAEALRGGVVAARVQAGRQSLLGGVGSLVRCDPALLMDGEEAAFLLGDACVAASIGVTREDRLLDIFDRVEEVGKLVGKLEAGQRHAEGMVEYRHELEEWEKAIAEKVEELEKDFKKAKKDRDKKKEDAEEKGKEFKEKKYKEDKKPKRPKLDPDDAVMARVVEGELPLVVEVHRGEELKGLLDATAAFDRLRLVIAGGTEAAPLADVLAERRIPVIVWPAPLGSEHPDELEGHDLSLAGRLAEAGVQVLIGTGGERPSRDLRLLAALAVGQGLDADEALSAITQRPATVFDVPGRLGAVERGKDADVLVLDGDPLDAATRIQFVVSKGRVVVEP